MICRQKKRTRESRGAGNQIILGATKEAHSEECRGEKNTDFYADLDDAIPPNDDELYQDYITMNFPQADEPVEYAPDHYRPSTLSPLSIIHKHRITNELWRDVRKGRVVRCQLHKIILSNESSRWKTHGSEHDTLPVYVKYVRLETTLLPFGEEVADEYKKTGHKCMGTVPLHPNPKKQEDKKQWEIVFEKLTSPNDDPDLQGAECWVEKNNAVRYFVIGNRKWYRIGDFLSLKMIMAPIVAMKKTGEYVTCCHCACQHSVNLQRLKNLGKDLGDKAERRHQLQNKTFPKANQVLSTADEGSRVLLNVYQAFCIVGPPIH